MLNCLWDLIDITKSCVNLKLLHLTKVFLFENLQVSETSTQTQPRTSVYKLLNFLFPTSLTHRQFGNPLPKSGPS